MNRPTAITIPRIALRRLGWLAVMGLLLVAFAAPAAATPDSGNNGTVKIHEGATEVEPIIHNDPHVCTFHLHFFFADPFQAGSWEIQEWAPGDKGTVVLTGTYDTNGDGEDRQPAQGVYVLPDGHYKLFWDGDADKHDKHKVFWVDCGDVDGTTTTSSTTTTETTDTTSTTETTGTTTTETSDTTTTTETTGTTTTETSAITTTETTDTTTTPGQTVLAETGAPGQSVLAETGAPSQSVLAETGLPIGNVSEGPSMTLPPTDSAIASGPAPETWRTILISIAALLGAILVLSPIDRATRRDRR